MEQTPLSRQMTSYCVETLSLTELLHALLTYRRFYPSSWLLLWMTSPGSFFPYAFFFLVRLVLRDMITAAGLFSGALR